MSVPSVRVEARESTGCSSRGEPETPLGSITVTSDRDHLAVAVGPKVYCFRNVLAAAKHRKPFKKQTSFRLSDTPSELVSDVAYTDNDTLTVLHGDASDALSWSFTLVRKVPRGDHVIRGSMSTTLPGQPGSLSACPGPLIAGTARP